MNQVYLPSNLNFRSKVISLRKAPLSRSKEITPQKIDKKVLRNIQDSYRLTHYSYSSLELLDNKTRKINLRHLDKNLDLTNQKLREKVDDIVKLTPNMKHKRKIVSTYTENEKEKSNQFNFRHDMFENMHINDYQAELKYQINNNTVKERQKLIKNLNKDHKSLDISKTQEQKISPVRSNKSPSIFKKNDEYLYNVTESFINANNQSQHSEPKLKFNQFKYNSQVKLFNKSSTFTLKASLSKDSQSPTKYRTLQKIAQNISQKASVNYQGMRNQFTRNETERNSLKIQMNELKHFQQSLITRSQNLSDFTNGIKKKDQELKKQKLSVYLNIYEDVKEHTGLNKKKEQLMQRAKEIAEIIHTNNPDIMHGKTEGHLQIEQQIIPNFSELPKFDINWLYKDIDKKTPELTLLNNESGDKNFDKTLQKSQVQIQTVNQDISDPKLRTKKVDKELLKILVDGWQNSKKKKPKLHPFKLLQINVKPNKEQKKLKKERIMNSLLNFLTKLNRCRIFMGQLTEEQNEIFPKKEYSLEGSFLFLRCTKFNNIQQVEKLLDQNFKLVYEYNELGHTALHIAAKEGHNQMIELLLSRGADYESKDMANRTPLYYAANQAHRTSFKTLIFAGAKPWAISTPDPIIQMWLKMIKKVQISIKNFFQGPCNSFNNPIQYKKISFTL